MDIQLQQEPGMVNVYCDEYRYEVAVEQIEGGHQVAVGFCQPDDRERISLMAFVPEDGGRAHGTFHAERPDGHGYFIEFSADGGVGVGESLADDAPDYDPTWACERTERATRRTGVRLPPERSGIAPAE